MGHPQQVQDLSDAAGTVRGRHVLESEGRRYRLRPGGVGFGFIRGRERYLLACRPGERRRLTVAACMPSVQLRIPAADPRLARLARLYFENYNFDATRFE